MNQKDEIINLIQNKPKHYPILSKKDNDLSKWVEENSLVPQDLNVQTKIYSALNSEDGICKNGRQKKVKRINDGWSHCDHASKCKCLSDKLSDDLREIKLGYSEDKKNAIEKKRKATTLATTGYENNLDSPEVKAKITKPKVSEEAYEFLTHCEWMYYHYVELNKTLVEIASMLGVYYSTVGEYCKKLGFTIKSRGNRSAKERELYDFVHSLDSSAKSSVRLDGENSYREIDIFVPSKNLAIEFNGIYWHSEISGRKDKKYHQDKRNLCRDHGIELITIWETDWDKNKSLVKRRIMHKMGVSEQKYHARKCKVIENDHRVEDFLNKNHLQGSINCVYSVSLEYEGNLVSVMTFGKPRYTKSSYEWELYRFSSIGNVVGAASKLVSYFLKIKNPSSVVSYSSKDWNTGSVYSKIGFSHKSSNLPGYKYTLDHQLLEDRLKFQKHKLENILDVFDKNLSEWENMKNNGYDRIWDCGTDTWVYLPKLEEE